MHALETARLNRGAVSNTVSPSHSMQQRMKVLGALCMMCFASACAAKHASMPPSVASPSQSSALPTHAPGALEPRILLHAPEILIRHKLRWNADTQHPEPAVARLLDDGRKALGRKPFSVIEKSITPPSGDKHDYLSLAPYAWPDPSKPGGVPYVNRDGEVNPERDSVPDHEYFSRLAYLTETLGLAYFITGDETYAHHAALLLHTFFIDPMTRMNPNLKYAQGVRGKVDGGPAGIIDTVPIAHLVEGVGLLRTSKSLSKEDQESLDRWFRDYLSWLRESELGRKEGQSKNNHGTWYDVQVVSLALATGQVDLARETLELSRKRRIGREIETDGRQPEELRRTRSWHYAIYNLQAFVALAGLGDRVGVDLWHYQTPDGRSIRKAIEWLIPFAQGKQPWTTPNIDGMKTEELWPILREAGECLHDTHLLEAASSLGGKDSDRLWLFLK